MYIVNTRGLAGAASSNPVTSRRPRRSQLWHALPPDYNMTKSPAIGVSTVFEVLDSCSMTEAISTEQ